MLIHLLNSNGGTVKWVEYKTHRALRERQITYNGAVYEQCLRLDSNTWEYRDIGPSSSPNTAELVETPQPPPHPVKGVSWADVDQWFAAHRNRTEPIQVSHVRDLESLIQAIRAAEAEAAQ